MITDIELLKEFHEESKGLISDMVAILEAAEGSPDQVKSLEQYALFADRIMGGAKSLAAQIGIKNHPLYTVGDYAALCKAVGYKASQIQGKDQFYEICVALLLDATEMLVQLVDGLLIESATDIKEIFSKTFLERLKWVSDQFGSEYRASVEVHKKTEKLSQSDIDDLLKKLGLD